MRIAEIIQLLENAAPPVLQEQYDNAGLITGDAENECDKILLCLDATAEVIDEAVANNCQLVIAHHPIIFGGIKKISASDYVGRALIAAIKNDIAIFAIHTNLDNMIDGVNGKMADLLELRERSILLPKKNLLQKLVVFVPPDHLDKVRNAIFNASGGEIGNYSECSFSTDGIGSYKAGKGTHPYVGKIGERHYETESRLEVVFPQYLAKSVVKNMIENHPYEEVAYDIYTLDNQFQNTGSGIIGKLPGPLPESAFLEVVKAVFKTPVIRHTPLTGRQIQTVALCGGAGSFLISKALQSGADFYISSDIKYHEFFDANGRMVIADIGHFESEQFTVDLIHDIIRQKFPTFAVLKSGIKTNPVNYYY